MDDFSFFEPYFQSNPQHARLFKVAKEVAAAYPGYLIEYYITSMVCILENMDDVFIQRRSNDFFHLLIAKILTTRFLPEDEPVCEVTFFNHSVAFPFQSKRVVGFFTSLSGIQVQAVQLIDALCKCHEGITLVRNSVLLLFRSHQNRTVLYFELEKTEGEPSPDEVQDLQENLEERGAFMAARWQESIPSLESSIKTLRWLMSEIEKGDPPHVMISLEARTPEKTRFFAFVCRFIDCGMNALIPQINYFGSEVECQFQKAVEGGTKEGIVLKIDLPNTPSLLVEKRQEVSRIVEGYVGPFRDVNGGLLEKIEQNFQALAKACPNAKGLREFFESITPEGERAICSPSLLRAMYSAIQKKQGYTLLEQENTIVVVLRVGKGFEKAWKETLSKQFSRLGFSEILTSSAAILSCFLRHPTQEEAEAFEAKTEALFQEWTQAEASQTLRLCTTVPFTSFDPRTGTEEETSYLHKMLFEGLMRIGPRGKPEPAIAEKVSVSKNKKRYTFHLRKSCWSNRMPLTSHDFLYSWNMILAKKELAPLSYLFDRIENVQEIKKGKMPPDSLGVNAIDDYTLEVRLQNPCSSFLEICALTLFSPICQTVDKKHPSWTEGQGKEYVCNGPFCLEKKDHSGGVTLTKNPFYWESEKTRLEKVTIPVVSQEEGKKLFLNKQVDALLYYFYKSSSFLDLGNLKVNRLQGAVCKRFLCFNCAKPPFHNKKVRKAIALVIDRKKILETFPHSATPSLSFYSPFYSEDNTNTNLPKSNHKARRLLMEALAEDSEVRENFFGQSISVLEGNKDLAAALCGCINEAFSANWTVSILKTNSRNYLRRKENVLASIYGWTDRIHEPEYFLGIFASRHNTINFTCWTHPSIQSVIEQIKTTQCRKEKAQLLKDAEETLIEEMPMVPLLDTPHTSICHPDIQGIYASRLQQFDIRFASKKRPSTPES